MWDAVLEPNCRRLACLGLGVSMSLSPGGPCLSCLGLCGTLSRILVRPRRRFEAMWDAVLEPNCRRLACLGLGGSMSPSPGGPCLSCLEQRTMLSRSLSTLAGLHVAV